MEKVFQGSLKYSLNHNVGHTAGTFGVAKCSPSKFQNTEGCEKAAGCDKCDEIRPEMLKAFSRGVLLLTRACQVSLCSGRVPKVWLAGMIIPLHKKVGRSECANILGISPETELTNFV